jgi:hypothetical protein
MKKQFYLFWLLIFPCFIQAQNVGVGTTNPLARLHVTDSNVIFSAATVTAQPIGFTLPINGTGSRLMWIPQKAAFRVGTTFTDDWDAANIGLHSFAAGFNTKAVGLSSISLGSGAWAFGRTSVAFGSLTNAIGDFSIVTGIGTNATGDITTVMGASTYGKAYASLTIGQYNDSVTTASRTSWVNTDPLLILGNGTANNARHNAAVVYKNGSMVLKNTTTVTTDPIGFTTPISGAGTRMMWLPEKSAFRAGTTQGSQWDAINIGAWSFATGLNTIASEYYATALGSNTLASGIGSTAMGSTSVATGDYSTAMGYGTFVSGDYSTAMGYLSEAPANFSTAIGYGTTASGDYSTAMGSNTTASGFYSTTMGNSTTASGNLSTAMGFGSYSKPYASLALGRYNDSIASSSKTSWVPTDPLFILGNGTTDNARHNAMVVYKNGNMVLKNTATVTTDPIGFATPISGAGTRMMWLPEKSAFRVGTVESFEWDASNTGIWSFATGKNTKATGINSTAMGIGTFASGSYSIAMGAFTTASGNYSTTMGNSTTASGFLSTAVGSVTNASGDYSTAMGSNTTASGFYSTTMGNGTTSSGNLSTAMGFGSYSKPYASLAIGQYNDSIASSSKTSWVSTDPLLILGNGTADNARANAMVVYKNGNTNINGYTQLGKTTEGSPAIKIKKLTGTSSNVDGGDANITHNLTWAKIIGVQVMVDYVPGAGTLLPGFTDSPGYEYSVSVTTSTINVLNKLGNSANILSKPIRILVTYEE